MEIINKTKRPLRIPLPGGKKLHLNPGGKGQIAAAAADHPPLKELVDAGEVELVNTGRSRPSGGFGGTKGPSSPETPSGGGIRHVGDR